MVAITDKKRLKRNTAAHPCPSPAGGEGEKRGPLTLPSPAGGEGSYGTGARRTHLNP